ncbi:MAG: PspA/IM30 family protein [Planctomycetes bacterium]|nr:PspA/IM30 family protein [Planctomycetota bacterium]
MSIFSRLFKIGQAKANAVVDSLENPELMLDQAIKDKEKSIGELRESVARCIATEKLTRKQLDGELKSRADWEAKAEGALKSGREDLAVKALNRASEHEAKSVTLQTNWESQKKGVDQLKVDLQKQQDQLAEYKRNRNFIVAQSQFAEAKKSIHSVRSKMNSGAKSADNLMERMKAKAEQSSAEADAAAELASEGSSLENEFKEMENSGMSADIEAKLAAMKSKMASK